MTDIGENYEYIRTIINNKIEIAKIDTSIVASKLAGYIILCLFFLGVLGLLTASLLVVVAVILADLTGSLITGILLSSSSLVILSVLVFSLRKSLIFAPVARLFYQLLEDEE